jgi:putative tricarboxylic transport membrane protein
VTAQHATADSRRRAPVAVGDVVLGALCVLGGLAVVLYARGMPTVGGLPGPGLFPMIIGWFFVVLGTALVLQTVVAARRGGAAHEGDGIAAPAAEEPVVTDHETDEEAVAAVEGPGSGSTAAPASTAQGGHWSNAAVVLGGIVFYVLAAELLGFPITMFLVLAAIMLVLRSRVVAAVLTAAGITACLYAVFELLLLVQLPDGFLG